MLISSELTVTAKEAPAKSVAAAAVIGRVRAIIGITGLKALGGGMSSQG